MGVYSFGKGLPTWNGVPMVGDSNSILTGDVYFVDSGSGTDSTACGKSISKPFASIDYAIDQCTASQGDVIFVLPGHTETIAAAGGITCDVAGISIIGLGEGNLRPTITWSATASSWLITAANVTLKNLITTISIDEVVSMFAVSAAGVTLDTVDFKEYGAKGATGQALQFLLTTVAADDLMVMNCRHKQDTAGNTAQVWIQLVGTDNSRILNNSIYMTVKAATTSICISGSTAVVGCEISGNKIAWLGATVTTPINLVTTSTGIISDNRVAGGAAVVADAAITGDKCQMFENYVTNKDGSASSAILDPTAGALT